MSERFLDFDHDPVTMARRLLGQRLVRIEEGARLAGRIVEVEAYLGAPDLAAHTRGGRRTPRNETMYAAAGHLYVYFTYGMHHCANVVCGREGEGVAVLLRALEPEEGLERMGPRRTAARRTSDLCSGPARLTQALGIDRADDGRDLRSDPDLFIERTRRRALPARLIEVTPRIGIGYAGAWAERPLRYLIRGNPNVSGRAAGRSGMNRFPRRSAAI